MEAQEQRKPLFIGIIQIIAREKPSCFVQGVTREPIGKMEISNESANSETPQPAPETTKPVKRGIPESLRKQLSEAGKKRARQMTHEDRVKAARAMWKKRIEKARLSESDKNKEPNGKQSPAPPPATG